MNQIISMEEVEKEKEKKMKLEFMQLEADQ